MPVTPIVGEGAPQARAVRKPKVDVTSNGAGHRRVLLLLPNVGHALAYVACLTGGIGRTAAAPGVHHKNAIVTQIAADGGKVLNDLGPGLKDGVREVLRAAHLR